MGYAAGGQRALTYGRGLRVQETATRRSRWRREWQSSGCGWSGGVSQSPDWCRVQAVACEALERTADTAALRCPPVLSRWRQFTTAIGLFAIEAKGYAATAWVRLVGVTGLPIWSTRRHVWRT